MKTNTTTAIKLSFSFYKENAKKSLQIAREYYKKGFGSWAGCMKYAWTIIRTKMFSSGLVKFVKVSTGELVQRVIAPIRDYTGFKSMDKEANFGLFRAIDVEKLATGIDPKLCIISFYLECLVCD